jgi:hypothetical protein
MSSAVNYTTLHKCVCPAFFAQSIVGTLGLETAMVVDFGAHHNSSSSKLIKVVLAGGGSQSVSLKLHRS